MLDRRRRGEANAGALAGVDVAHEPGEVIARREAPVRSPEVGIEQGDNPTRRQSALNYLSPVEFERRYCSDPITAA
jgi:transposase InsO family protein